jgi:hypothetical protein
VIYAKAVYKPRVPKITSVALLIDDDKKTFLSHDPKITIAEVASLRTADGHELRSFTFYPEGAGNWEQVSYGEEDEFFLVFTLSSRSRDGLLRALDDYRKFIRTYKRAP